MAVKPTMLCAKTVTHKEYSKQNDGQNKDQIPVSENWLYRTRMQPVPKDPNKDVFGYSEDAPEWFKVTETTNVKDHKIEKSQGYDGTLTILSRISGWITVSPHSRNRQKRLGRYGPFDKSKKGNNFQNVSDLAPAWMQTEFSRNDETGYKNQLAPVNVRQEKKRVFLVDKEQPIKNAWSAGNFRHNVMTADEAKKFSFGVGEVQNRIFEWKEDVNKQKYDKPIAGKIGSRY